MQAALPALPPKRARVIAIAAGKAAQAMTAGAFARWPGVWSMRSLAAETYPATGDAALPGSVDQRVASHPIDHRSVAAAEEALCLSATLGPSDLLLALVSGGASALLRLPRDWIPRASRRYPSAPTVPPDPA